MIKTKLPDGGKGPRTILHVLRHNHPLRWLWAIAVMVIGCQTYYKAVPLSEKYIVLHCDSAAFHLQQYALDVDRRQIKGFIEPLSQEHQYYIRTKPGRKPTPYTRSHGNPLVEVHIYGDSCKITSDGEVFLPVDNIRNAEEYVFDAKATKRSRIWGAVAFITGVLIIAGVAGAVALGEGGFCPEVYVPAGMEYQFAGELYACAMHARMECDDYLKLSSLQAVDGFFAVRIANHETEADRTNQAELKLVEHAMQTKVAFDQTGQAHSIADPRSPDAAINSRGHDLLPAVAKQDSAYALFDDDARPDKSMAGIDLRFARPTSKQDGKLLIRGRSTIWQGYVYERFIEQFGTGYHAYAGAQEGKTATEHYTWLRNQGLSLSVYVETKDGWILREAIPPTGAGADRDIVVPIDLADVPGDEIRVRLSCAFMAWQLDQVAMDFTPDEKMRVITIPPFMARDEKGEDVTHLITATDDRYLVQADSGSMVTVTYLAPPMREDRAYTAFLHGRGYYTLDRDYAHKPNPGFTKQFERDGQFSKFSKERYADLLEHYSVRTGQDDNAKR